MNLHATRQNYRLGQLSSAKCQAFYAAPDAVPAAAYDAALGAYRPDPTSARPLHLVSRPFTYEDTRLRRLPSTIGRVYNEFLNRPGQALVLGALSLLFGFYLAGSLSTIFGAAGFSQPASGERGRVALVTVRN